VLAAFNGGPLSDLTTDTFEEIAFLVREPSATRMTLVRSEKGRPDDAATSPQMRPVGSRLLMGKTSCS